jgi:hypothetical protein
MNETEKQFVLENVTIGPDGSAALPSKTVVNEFITRGQQAGILSQYVKFDTVRSFVRHGAKKPDSNPDADDASG